MVTAAEKIQDPPEGTETPSKLRSYDTSLLSQADAMAGKARDGKLQLEDVENLIRAAFRETTAYPTVARVKPFERVSRSALAGEIHAQFSDVAAVAWTTPAADPVPGMELPTINSLSVGVV